MKRLEPDYNGGRIVNLATALLQAMGPRRPRAVSLCRPCLRRRPNGCDYGNGTQIFRGAHGSPRPGEMLVPLIAVPGY